MIVLAAQYHGKPGHGDTIEAALKRVALLVKEHEPGCALYQAARSQENPDQFLLYQHYVDEAALMAHLETPHFKEIVEGTIIPLLEHRERQFYTLVAG